MAHSFPHPHLPRIATWTWSDQELLGLLVTLLVLVLLTL